MKGKPDAALGRQVVARLRRMYPDAGCELHHGNALQLLVATILSAQCTDERVNRVTPALFRKYPDAAAYAGATAAELEADIRSTGFFRNKARSLMGLGRELCARFGGEVPRTMDELVTLPGVGRKTANVLLATIHGDPSIIVDTHVKRLAGRLGLSQDEDPEQIERDLWGVLPRKDWTFSSQALIWHGRRVCHARHPACAGCALADVCPSAELPAAAGRKPARKVRARSPRPSR